MLINQPLTSSLSDTGRLRRLFFARLMGSFLLLLLFSWFGNLSHESAPIPPHKIFILWLILAAAQAALFRFPYIIIGNLLFQLISDLLLIGLLVYTSGGIASPVIFLLGVIIIIAGTQAHVLVVLIIAVLSSITYLLAINAYASIHHQDLFDQNTLQILLQISLFFLTGGIMALIARRHANLQLEGQQTTTQHRHLQKLHRQVLSSMQEGIIILDKDLMVKDYNDATADMIGMNHNHINNSIYTVLEIPAEVVSFIQTDEPAVFRCELQHKGLQLLLTTTQLLEEDSTWLLTIVNITETRKLEKQLAEQDKLASIGQMASMLAHEIRNPMQTIAQAVELMGLQLKNNKLEFIITDELSRLNRLVSDMLDYASPLHPHKQKVDILDLINSSIAQIDLTKELDIRIKATEQTINIDPDHFRLVIDNLLRNAVKVSPTSGSVEITFESHDNEWSLLVRDHGPGINLDIQNSLFEPFQTSSKHGTGLGLATVWQVCLANSWKVQVDESIEDGACFVVFNLEKKKRGEEKHG